MNEMYTSIGSILVCVGVILIFFPITTLMFWFGSPYGGPNLQISGIVIIAGIVLLGFFVTYNGISILRRFREGPLLITKADEPIHSAKVWMKETEAGLYLTSCGRVVSINQTSQRTAHSGYSFATAESTTCRECAQREGRRVLDSVDKRGDWR